MTRKSKFVDVVRQPSGPVTLGLIMCGLVIIGATPASLLLASCSTQEITRTEREVLPVVIDNGHAIANGAKVATDEPILVVVYGADGKPVPGDQPTALRANGMEVIPPDRAAEMRAAERALGRVMAIVDGLADRSAADQITAVVVEELGR